MLTGTQAAWKDDRFDKIKAAMEAALGRSVLKAHYLRAFCEGLSNSDVPHLVTNVAIPLGQAVLSVGVTGPTAAPGFPTPIPALPGTNPADWVIS